VIDPRPPDFGDLDRDLRSFVARRFARLAFGPGVAAHVSHFLQAMVAVERGELREIGRTVRGGCPIVVLLLNATGACFWLQDRQLGAAKAPLVAELARLLGG
jgi:hypothetical protein